MSAVVPKRLSEALATRAVPAHLHDALAASAWVAAATGEAQITATVEMLRAGDPLAGHLAGLTILIDHHRHITTALITTNRDSLLVEALVAFAIGWRANEVLPPRVVWRTIERLTLHVSTLPPELVALLPSLCDDRYAPTREVAIALAIRAGLRDEIAAAIPVDATAKHNLRRALQAIDAARQAPRGVEAILATALAAWRETRDPALLPWIELCDRECTRQRDPLVDAQQEPWLAVAVANDPADTMRLLDGLHGERDDRRAARIAALARRDLHPRYAEVPELAPLVTGDDVRAAAPQILAALARDLESLARKWQLLDEHAHDPGNRGLREVLADVLVELGDPQGELITLQSALADGVVDPKAAARVRQILDQHGARLIGPLPGIARDRVRFARGFPVSLHTEAYGEKARAFARHPGWSTVEELSCRYDATPENLPLLRMLEVGHSSWLEPFVRRGPHPHLELLASAGPWVPVDFVMCPKLRIVAGRYDPTELATIGASGIPIAIVYNLWNYQLAPLLRARAEGPPLLRLSGAYSIVNQDPARWRIELVRGADFAHACMPSLWHRDAHEILQELARHVDTIYVHTDETLTLRSLAADDTIEAELIRTEHDVDLTAPVGSPVSIGATVLDDDSKD